MTKLRTLGQLRNRSVAKGTSNLISIRMPVDNNMIEFEGYFTVYM